MLRDLLQGTGLCKCDTRLGKYKTLRAGPQEEKLETLWHRRKLQPKDGISSAGKVHFCFNGLNQVHPNYLG